MHLKEINSFSHTFSTKFCRNYARFILRSTSNHPQIIFKSSSNFLYVLLKSILKCIINSSSNYPQLILTSSSNHPPIILQLSFSHISSSWPLKSYPNNLYYPNNPQSSSKMSYLGLENSRIGCLLLREGMWWQAINRYISQLTYCDSCQSHTSQVV